MEKKVPERKVNLHDGDIIYVYDKRINKCIKPGCEGTVKYGLVLRVNVSGEETCNCFECNKCHMKYTPYPNYVRLTKTDMLNIFNKDEVAARDAKRAEDARKQALREKRKNAPAKSFDKKPERRFEKKYDKKYDKKYEKDEPRKYGNVVITRGSYSSASYSSGDGKRYSKPYDKNRSNSYKTRTGSYHSSYNKFYNKDHQE